VRERKTPRLESARRDFVRGRGKFGKSPSAVCVRKNRVIAEAGRPSSTDFRPVGKNSSPRGWRLCPEHRHARFSAATCAFGLEDIVDFRILIFVLDLRPALLYILAGILEVLDVELKAPWF